MADPERLFISKVLRTKDMDSAVLLANGDFFHDPDNGDVWDFMAEYWQSYGECPSFDMVRMEYPNWVPDKTPDPLAAYADLLQASHRSESTKRLIIDSTDRVREEDIDGALSLLGTGVIDIAKSVTRTEDVDVVGTWDTRLDKWRKMAEDPGALLGIPTGFDFIDKATGGMQPEQFYVLIGPQKAGKSSIALRTAMVASEGGTSVVFMSYEMSNLEQEARYDAMRAGFNPNKLLLGRMSALDFEALDAAGKQAKNRAPIYFVHDMGARSLSGMIAKVHQYKPGLLIVDGAYLMDAELPESDAADWKALTKLSRALKVLAQTRKIPVFATTQALESKMTTKGGLRTSSAGYTSAWGQDGDVILGVEPADEDNIGKIKVLDGRNVGRSSAEIVFDWDRGLIEERESWDGEEEDE